VRYLLQAGANPNAVSSNIYGVTPLILASQMNHPEAVQALIEASANVNYSRPSDQITSLILAAQEGHIEVVRALIAALANVDHTDAQGATALMLAAKNRRIEVVRALLAAKADPRIVAHNGHTALFIAKYFNLTAIAALLEARLAELAAAAPVVGSGSALSGSRARSCSGQSRGNQRSCSLTVFCRLSSVVCMTV